MANLVSSNGTKSEGRARGTGTISPMTDCQLAINGQKFINRSSQMRGFGPSALGRIFVANVRKLSVQENILSLSGISL